MNDEALQLAGIVRDIQAKWTPHSAQIPPLRSLFRFNAKQVFLENGRKWGKSEFECYVLWRWAATRPGAYYYIGPFQSQAAEIIWQPQRLQNFGPPSWVAKIYNGDYRIVFKNGSFIKVDGSENYPAYRGINPHGMILDEFQDFRPEFWQGCEPNMATFEAPVVFGGTPPETEVEQWNVISAECKSKGTYFNYPSWANPHISRQWLRDKKAALYARGDGVIWEREYGAKRVYGGPGAIFPQLDRKRHVHNHDELIARLKRDWDDLSFYVTYDPGTITVFGVLFSAANPYRNEIYHLDHLYLTTQSETSTSHVIPAKREKAAELFGNVDTFRITETYDEAASWFANEAAQSFGQAMFPTTKATAKKEHGLSLIKDQLLHGRVFISDRCEKLLWEMENYVRDKHGKIPKINDHLIDCYRYVNAASGMRLTEEFKHDPYKLPDGWRAVSLEHDLEEVRKRSGRYTPDDVTLPDMEFS